MKVWILGSDKSLVEMLAQRLEERINQPVYIVVSLSLVPGRDEPGSWCMYRHPECYKKTVEWEESYGDGKNVFPIFINSFSPPEKEWVEYEHFLEETKSYIDGVVKSSHGIDVNGQSVDDIVRILESDVGQFAGERNMVAA